MTKVQSLAYSVDFIPEIQQTKKQREIHAMQQTRQILHRKIDNEHQISFSLHDNTKETDDTNANYSFACGVDFNRYLVDKIITRDKSYSVDEIEFVDKDIDN